MCTNLFVLKEHNTRYILAMFVTHKEATKSIHLPYFPPNNLQKETCLDDNVKMTKWHRPRLHDALTLFTAHVQ